MRQLTSVALVILVLFGCKKENSNSNDCSGIYPLKVGNIWAYKASYISADGKVDSSKTLTTRLKSTTTVNGADYFAIDSLDFLLRNSDCNTLSLYHPNSNKEFNVTTKVTTNDTLVYSLESNQGLLNCRGVKVLLNKDRTVINGKDCYKMEMQFTNCDNIYYRKRYYFINEAVGTVRSEVYTIDGDDATLTEVDELQSYTLK